MVDAENPAAAKDPSLQKTPEKARQLDLETAILRIVEQDPFASIREIKAEINFSHTNLEASWWRVFTVLRAKKLLTRRSRFKYILGRR